MIALLSALITGVSLAMAPAPVSVVAVEAKASSPAPAAAVRSRDPRIRIVDYDADRVVSVAGAFRTATQVQFAEDETILHVAVGDAAAWEVAAEGPVLFIKPSTTGAPTNLLVTTERPAGRRHYSFALSTRARPGRDDETPFVLRFRYPEDADSGRQGRLAADAALIERRILELKLERGVVEGRRNLAYSAQGSTDLAPSEISDNGRFTVMRFPANQAVPAVYRVGPDGTEGLIPFDVRGEFLVVHGVEAQLRLRRGREVTCLYNDAFDPRGLNPGTGSAAGDVERTDRPGEQP